MNDWIQKILEYIKEKFISYNFTNDIDNINNEYIKFLNIYDSIDLDKLNNLIGKFILEYIGNSKESKKIS